MPPKKKIETTNNSNKIEKIKKKTIPKALRMKLWELTIGNTLSGNCYCCEREVKIDNFEAGHIIAEIYGGTTTLDNLRVVCKPCNTSCATMNLDDFKKLLTPIIQQKDIKTAELTIEQRKELIKKNSIYRMVIKTGDEEKNFDKICDNIANNETKYQEWYTYYNADVKLKVWLDLYNGNIKGKYSDLEGRFINV